MKSKINRNDACPCGSGKKYKHCHENKEAKSTSKVPWIMGGIIIIVIGIFILKPNQSLKPAGGKPGQVWSEEHGHWHDAPARNAPLPAAPSEQAQSSGQPKPGQVWSEEHGHWHDAPSNQAASTAPAQVKSTQPPGPAPEGKVWSEEHGHWHNAPATAQSQPQ